MAHAQKPDFVFRAKRTSPFKSAGGRQFSRLLAAEVCASAVIILATPCSEVVWRVLATHCIRQFPLHFPSRASPCAIIFQLDSTSRYWSGSHCSVFYRKYKHSQHSRSLATQFIWKCNWLSIHSQPLITWLPTLLIALHYVTPLRATKSSLRSSTYKPRD